MTSKLNILCIDSSTEACSVALKRADQQVFEHFMLAPREHTQKILPTVEQVIQQANIQLSDIDVVAYGQGPGSFTGVRIGISIAQGLAFGLDTQMVGISTLQAMAQQAFEQEGYQSVYAAIDARMGEIYFAEFKNNNGLMTLINNEMVVKPDALINLYEDQSSIYNDAGLVGTGWDAYPNLNVHFSSNTQTQVLYPNATYMLPSACQSIESGLLVTPDNVKPVYLRDTVTWKKLPGRE